MAVQTFKDGELSHRVLHKANALGVKEISKLSREGKVVEADVVDQIPYRYEHENHNKSSLVPENAKLI